LHIPPHWPATRRSHLAGLRKRVIHLGIGEARLPVLLPHTANALAAAAVEYAYGRSSDRCRPAMTVKRVIQDP